MDFLSYSQRERTGKRRNKAMGNPEEEEKETRATLTLLKG